MPVAHDATLAVVVGAGSSPARLNRVNLPFRPADNYAMGLLREFRTRVQRDQLDLQRDLDGIVELASWGIDLTQPQWLRLFLFVANTPTARRLEQQLDGEGWETTVTSSNQDERKILCAQRRVELSLANVSRYRRRFQTLSARIPGTEYDGWEAGA